MIAYGEIKTVVYGYSDKTDWGTCNSYDGIPVTGNVQLVCWLLGQWYVWSKV